jgi:hypothetical protein
VNFCDPNPNPNKGTARPLQRDYCAHVRTSWEGTRLSGKIAEREEFTKDWHRSCTSFNKAHGAADSGDELYNLSQSWSWVELDPSSVF